MSDASTAAQDAVRVTPLHQYHIELGAKMVPFAGYDMPVQYSGIKAEHLHTRQSAGLFDVSHMGQFVLRTTSATPTKADGDRVAAVLETLVPADVLGLEVGRQRYALLTNETGGIIDDLMVVRRETDLLLVVNAACKQGDATHIRAHLPEDLVLEELSDSALLALQGPKAEAVLASCFPEAAEALATMRFMDARNLQFADMNCHVTRSGYTGEDGFELSVSANQAEALARQLLADERVLPVGLGARDSLRLEAGLCLYGHDIDTETDPIAAALQWSIGAARRVGGEREGGFLGADRILSVMASGAIKKRVGLLPEGKAPVREGAIIVDADQRELGRVCSGGFGPSVNKPIAMAYVDAEQAKEGQSLLAMVRGKALPVTVARLPFVTPGYKR